MSSNPANTAPTPKELQDLILREVTSPVAGLDEPNVRAARLNLEISLPLLWSLYAPQGARSPRLQYLYAKRHAVDIFVLAVWPDVDSSEGGVEESRSDEAKALGAIRDDLTLDITALLAQLNASTPSAVGPLTRLTPTVVPCGVPDPYASRYRGDPLRRGPFYR